VIALSVNLNKVATLRNARGGSEPSVRTAAAVSLDAGAPGVTVHPRADERHIRRRDVIEIAELLATRRSAGHPHAEYNIEGDPRPDLMDLVVEVKPDQCTLVPVMPGEITSQAGWPAGTAPGVLGGAIDRLRASGVRVSLFVEPDPKAIRWAADLSADRVELYTEPFARIYARSPKEGQTAFVRYVEAARLAHDLGLGVNAGHDLDLENLTLFRTLPYLDEVSIGHALMTHALWVGLAQSVKDYLRVLSATQETGS